MNKLAVDRSDTGYQSIRRGVLQVLARSTTLLSGERKPSVLVEGTRITQSSDVLPSGPLTPAMALGNGMRAGVVGEQRSGVPTRSGPLGVPPDS
ncbi:MAG: hypothetical protein R2735_12495 [Microthrixaceae bacterium]